MRLAFKPALPTVSGYHPNYLGPKQNKRQEKFVSFILPHCLSWNMISPSSPNPGLKPIPSAPVVLMVSNSY